MTLRNVVVMLVLAVLAVLAWISLRDGGKSADTLPATIPAFARDDVRKLSVSVGEQSLVLRRRDDRSDAWEVQEGTASVRADASAVDDVLSALLRQEVRAKFERAQLSAADLAGYGLNAPAATVELTTPKGPLLVRYGKKTREGTGVYVDTGDNTDVWVVGGTLVDSVPSLFAGGARSKRLTDLRMFDIGRVEIVRGGVTALLAERDATQVWRVTQPYKGFAEPQAFETLLSRLASTEIAVWAEVGAQDLARYGLASPTAEVRLTPRKGGDPAVILVGAATPDGGGVHAMEKGVPNVAVLPKRFAEALATDPATIRDDSFTRLGIDGTALTVKLGSALWEVRKEGSSWDVTKPDRFPGDESAIRAAMERIRSWKTVEFLDAAKPSDHGISDEGDRIEIELQGGGKTVLLLGAAGTDGTRYAIRRGADGDSGVERVDGSVLDMLGAGYAQFRRKTVREFSTYMGQLERVARDNGRSDEGRAVQTVVLSRDTAKSGDWELSTKEGPGVTGTMDRPAVSALVNSLASVVAREWLFWDASKNDAMGFFPPLAETASVAIRFSAGAGTPPGGAEQVLLIGKKRPEGGYFARFGGDEGWAFVLSEEDARPLLAPVTK